MLTAFQPSAFQASAFQIVAESIAVEDRPSGGWAAFRGWGKTRWEREREELIAEIDALEQHIAESRKVPRPLVRLEAQIREYRAPLPAPALRAVERALTVQTLGAFAHAEAVLKRLQEEEEEFAVLIGLALH